VIIEFEEEDTYLNANEETHHDEETPSAQNAFARDVQSILRFCLTQGF